ncbi:MAG: hypothetical protein JNJ54_01175 [Myxococcaceae bacterium]|nr:hypothetical protein [Myxococcaceae bacterium]
MRKKLGEILLASGAVTQADLDLALGDQTAGEPARLGDLLVSLGRLTPMQLAKALSQQHAIPFIQLPPVPHDVLGSVPVEYQQQHRFVPFRVTGDSISIAMADPSNTDLIEELETSLNKKVNRYVGAGDEIDAAHAMLAPPSVELPSIAPVVAPVSQGPSADALFGGLDESPGSSSSSLGDELFSGLDLPPTTADVPPPPAVLPVSASFELEQVPDAQVVEVPDEEEPEFFEAKPVVPVVHAPAPPSIPPSPAPMVAPGHDELSLEPADHGLTSSSSGTFSVSTFDFDPPPEPQGNVMLDGSAPSGVLLTESQAVFQVPPAEGFDFGTPAAEPSGTFEVAVDAPPVESGGSFQVSLESGHLDQATLSESANASFSSEPSGAFEVAVDAAPPAESSGNFEVAIDAPPAESSGDFEIGESSGDFPAQAQPAAPPASVDDFFAQTPGAFSTQEESVSIEELPQSSDSQPQPNVSEALFGSVAAMTDELFADAEQRPQSAPDFPFEPPPEPHAPSAVAHAPAPAPLPPPQESGPPVPELADAGPPPGAPRESLPSWLGATPSSPEGPQIGPTLVIKPGEWTGQLDDVPPSRLIVGAVKALVLKGLVSEAEILAALDKS